MMHRLHQPQEIEVWYVIPSLRKEIAKELIKIGLTQSEVSKVLVVTRAAVSQYINDKRAKHFSFPEFIQEKIEHSAKRLKREPSLITEEIQRLVKEIRNTKLLCTYHKMHSEVEKNCTVCIE